MGNRMLVQFIQPAEVLPNGKTIPEEFSPVVSFQWSAHVKRTLLDLRSLMENRKNDIDYACARFIGLNHVELEGNLSLGFWNTAAKLTAEDSFGNNGVALVDVSNYTVHQLNEYLYSGDGVAIEDMSGNFN